MIFLLTALLAASTAGIFFLNRKNIISPGVIVSGMFFISSFVAMLNLGTWQYSFQPLTAAVILTGVWCFEAGELCADRFLLRQDRVKRIIEKRRAAGDCGPQGGIALPWQAVAAVCAVLLAMLVYYGADIYRLSVAYGNRDGISQMIRYARDAFVARADISKLGNLFFGFSQCTTYMFVFILLNNLVYVGLRKKDLLYAAPVAVFCAFVTLSGARGPYIYLFAYAIVVWIFLYQGRHRWDEKNTKKFLLVGVSAVAVFFVIFRFSGFLKNSGVGTTAWKSLSKYTGFSIAGLNEYLCVPWPPDSYFGEHTLNNVYSVLNQLGITHVPIATPFLPFITLPGGVSSNIYTSLAVYIQDYMFPGMVIIMFLMGLLYALGNGYLHDTGSRGLGLILYGTFFYPLVMISLEDMFLYGLVSTTTVYQVIFYLLLDWLLLRHKGELLYRKARAYCSALKPLLFRNGRNKR